jgi:hypothetical protein
VRVVGMIDASIADQLAKFLVSIEEKITVSHDNDAGSFDVSFALVKAQGSSYAPQALFNVHPEVPMHMYENILEQEISGVTTCTLRLLQRGRPSTGLILLGTDHETKRVSNKIVRVFRKATMNKERLTLVFPPMTVPDRKPFDDIPAMIADLKEKMKGADEAYNAIAIINLREVGFYHTDHREQSMRELAGHIDGLGVKSLFIYNYLYESDPNFRPVIDESDAMGFPGPGWKGTDGKVRYNSVLTYSHTGFGSRMVSFV